MLLIPKHIHTFIATIESELHKKNSNSARFYLSDIQEIKRAILGLSYADYSHIQLRIMLLHIQRIINIAKDAEKAKKAFAGCDGLADRDGFVIVKYVLHSYCGEDADVNVPNGVGYIGTGAFSGKSIVSITIPASVSTIEHQAFISCRKLTKVKILNGNTKISDKAFMWSDKVTIYSPAGGTVEAFANEKDIPFVAE
mgnify:CR=1 FL=1